MRFTPTNIDMNWIFSSFGFIFKLNRRGSQCVAPAITANTAPIDST